MPLASSWSASHLAPLTGNELLLRVGPIHNGPFERSTILASESNEQTPIARLMSNGREKSLTHEGSDNDSQLLHLESKPRLVARESRTKSLVPSAAHLKHTACRFVGGRLQPVREWPAVRYVSRNGAQQNLVGLTPFGLGARHDPVQCADPRPRAPIVSK